VGGQSELEVLGEKRPGGGKEKPESGEEGQQYQYSASVGTPVTTSLLGVRGKRRASPPSRLGENRRSWGEK